MENAAVAVGTQLLHPVRGLIVRHSDGPLWLSGQGQQGRCHCLTWPTPACKALFVAVWCAVSQQQGGSKWSCNSCPRTEATPPGLVWSGAAHGGSRQGGTPLFHAVPKACLTQDPWPDMMSLPWVSLFPLTAAVAAKAAAVLPLFSPRPSVSDHLGQGNPT